MKDQTPLNYNGRPCQITGSSSKRHQKWGWQHYSTVRYLDGLQPATDQVARGKLKAAAKKLRRAEVLVWQRVDELVQAKMEPDRAKAQATAELAKGILADERPF